MLLDLSRLRRFALAFWLAAPALGCGKVDYKSESYEPEAVAATTGANQAYLVLTPARTETGGLFGRTIRIGPPYKVTLVVKAPHDYPAPVRLLSLIIRRDGTSKVVRDRTAPARTTMLNKTAGGTDWTARIDESLGDDLAFVQGAKLEVTAIVQLPYEAGETTLTRAFLGKLETSEGANIDYVVGQ